MRQPLVDAERFGAPSAVAVRAEIDRKSLALSLTAYAANSW